MHRLKKRSQFQNVYKRGRSFKNSNIALCVLANGAGLNRIGLTVSSSRVPLSVARNRCKRLLREAYRLTSGGLRRGYDIVFTSTRDISGSGLEGVMDELRRLYKKAEIQQ